MAKGEKQAKNGDKSTFRSQFLLGITFGIATFIIQLLLWLFRFIICGVTSSISFPITVIVNFILFPAIFLLIVSIILRKYLNYNYKFFLIAFGIWLILFVAIILLFGEGTNFIQSLEIIGCSIPKNPGGYV